MIQLLTTFSESGNTSCPRARGTASALWGGRLAAEAADPRRGAQRAELHCAVESDVDPRNATFGFINQDRNNPRDIQIGARFSF